jgi:ABC-type nitrate/sulfonate/bicarbonate transport system ATPase subunit
LYKLIKKLKKSMGDHDIMQDFIVIDNLSFSFGQQAILKKVNLVLERGSSYALIGKSGLGKSTLLNLIAGFLKTDSGSIKVNGKFIEEPRRETSFLFQELGLFPWQTVEETVAMPLKLKGENKNINEKVNNILSEMKLENHKDKYPIGLSGGERQRVALARTLIGEPDLLLMDEPTSALDAMTKEEIQEIIFRQQQKGKVTLLFVTHDIEEAMMLGKYILIMNQEGSISKIDNPYYSISNPREQIGFYDECIKLRKLLKREI